MLPHAPANVSTHGRGHFICLFYFSSSHSYSSLMKIQLSCGKTLQSRRRISPAVGGWGGGTGAGVGGDQLRVQPLKIAVR